MIKKRKVTTTYEYNENGTLLKKTVVEETEEEVEKIKSLNDLLTSPLDTIPTQYGETNTTAIPTPTYLKPTPVEYSDSTTTHYDSISGYGVGKVEG